MAELNIDLIEKHYDEILKQSGSDSYIDWDSFTKSTTEANNSIEQLAKQLHLLKELHQKTFITNMKKLKGMDVPDVIKSVRAKKLPREALRTILPRFKLNGDVVELIDTPDTLKNNAVSASLEFVNLNKKITELLGNTTKAIQEQITAMKASSEEPSKQEGPKYSFDEAKLSEVCKNVQITHLPASNDCIGLETYAQIVDAARELCTDQYTKMTQESRKFQRDVLKQPGKYLTAMTDYMHNSEALILQAQANVCEKSGVSQAKFDESEEAMLERGFGNNLLSLQAMTRAKLKESLRPSKEVSLEEAKKIIEYQIKVVSEKSDHIKEVFSHLPINRESAESIPMLLTLILNDYVYLEHGLEEEDFMKNLGEEVFMTNPDIAELFQKMELAIIGLMQKLEFIPKHMGQYMEESIKNGGKPGAVPQGMMPPGMIPPPGMLPPGMLPQPGFGPMPGMMMPSSDPMALLQFQQMQAQMQAMHNQNKK